MASKLVECINLGSIKEYDPIEVLVDLEDSENSGNKSQITPTSNLGSAQQFRADIIDDNNTLDKLCTPYVRSKLTQVVKRNKSMIPTTNKIEERHADLWGLYDPLF